MEQITEKGVMVTESAVKKFKVIAEQQGNKDYGLRIMLMPGGCSGFRYGLDFVKQGEKGDVEFDNNGFKVFVEKESAHLVKGMTIDYVETLNDIGFKMHNPNVHSSCGCGSGSC